MVALELSAWELGDETASLRPTWEVGFATGGIGVNVLSDWLSTQGRAEYLVHIELSAVELYDEKASKGPSWEVLTTDCCKGGTGSKKPPDVSRGEAQIEVDVLLESLVVELWDGTASEPGNPFTVEPTKEAIKAPLLSAIWSGMLLAPFSCSTGSIIMEAAAVLARNNCRLSSGEARRPCLSKVHIIISCSP